MPDPNAVENIDFETHPIGTQKKYEELVEYRRKTIPIRQENMDLELELQKKKNDIEALYARIDQLESEALKKDEAIVYLSEDRNHHMSLAHIRQKMLTGLRESLESQFSISEALDKASAEATS